MTSCDKLWQAVAVTNCLQAAEAQLYRANRATETCGKEHNFSEA